jgi:hypothetical protein
MKGLKIIMVMVILTSISLLFLIKTGYAQNGRNQPLPTQDVMLVKVIKDCYVPYINTKRLYADSEHREYPISSEVEVRENGKKGLRLDIKTIAGVGFITKADLYILKDEVVKIVIVDLQQ